MLVVTGSKRSGTSMWMQILTEAGFPYIGERFLGNWADSIVAANPAGFFESKLRYGINYSNNPNLQTGQYLHPQKTTLHAIKIFGQGIAKTELAFLHRVIATIRPWDVYCRSIHRLIEMENAYTLSLKPKEQGISNEVKVLLRMSNIHPALLWWQDNFSIVIDAHQREYPIRFCSYADLIAQPEQQITHLLNWCVETLPKDLCHALRSVEINFEAAIQVVQPRKQTVIPSDTTSEPIYPPWTTEVNAFELPLWIEKGFQQMVENFEAGGFSQSALQDLLKVHEWVNERMTQQEKEGWERKRLALRELGLSNKRIERLIEQTQKRKQNRYDRRSPSPLRIELWDESDL